MEPTKQELLESALFYAENGIYVFPIVYGYKVPLANTRGHNDSTIDIELVKKIWGAKRLNIGIDCGKSKLTIVDEDIPDGKNNFESLPGYAPFKTLTVTTRSNTTHHYFLAGDSGIRSSTSTLAKHVDVRGVGGYVVAPPSYVYKDDKAGSGSYEFDDIDIAPEPIPDWLLPLLLTIQSPPKPKKKPNAATAALMGKNADFPYCEVNREKIINAVKSRIAKENCQNEGAFFNLLCEIRSLVYLCGWSDEQAWDLFDSICQWDDLRFYDDSDHYDATKNKKRWDAHDFKADGRTYKSLLAELKTKPDAVVPKETNWQQSAPETPPKQKPKKAPLKLLTVRDVQKFKNANWVMKSLLPAKGVGAIYGPPSSGKSFVIVDALAALARGLKSWHGFKINQKHVVVYLALEGGTGVKNRLSAYLKHHRLETLDNFFIIMDAFDIRTDFLELIELIQELKLDVQVFKFLAR